VKAVADVIVVGAGAAGTSTAFGLADAGIPDVALLDKGSIASGNTGRSSAVVRLHYTTTQLVRMAVHSRRIFRHFAEAVGGECGFVSCGYLAIVDPGDRAALEHNIRLQQSEGAETTLLEPDALTQLVPELYIEDLGAAAFEPDSGYADPVLTSQAYAAAAQERGAELLPNTRVLSILTDTEGVAGVRTDRGDIAARSVVLCTGVWTASLLRSTGIDLPISAIREEMVIFERPEGFGRHPAILDLSQLMYLRPEGSSLMLVGNTDHRVLPKPVDPESYQQGATERSIEVATAKVTHRFPIMASGAVRGGYAGLYDVTPDLNPILEETPVVGLFVAAGFSGHGFKLAPAVGTMMAELVAGRTSSTVGVDIEFFSSRRYEEGRPIKGERGYRLGTSRY
jgi:glycine/D-amino acid oxidase-like deaminating enzyme